MEQLEKAVAKEYKYGNNEWSNKVFSQT
jgi:hypothetical protein